MYSPSHGEDRQQLLDEIHELKYQNERLKLEKEIATVQSQLSKSSNRPIHAQTNTGRGFVSAQKATFTNHTSG